MDAETDIARMNNGYYERKAKQRDEEKRKARNELETLNQVYNDMKREIEKSCNA